MKDYLIESMSSYMDKMEKPLLTENFSVKLLKDYINRNISDVAKVKKIESDSHSGMGFKTVTVYLTPEKYNNDGYGYSFDFIFKKHTPEWFYKNVVDTLNHFINEDGGDLDESCNSKSKKELKEDTRSAIDLYCDDINNEALNGYGRISSLTDAQVKTLLSIAKAVSNKYKVKSLTSLPYNTRKDLQNWTKAATQSGVDSKVFNDYAKNVMYAYDELNESLKKSKDSEDELYKKIAGYVKKYDSGELDIDETVKQILDFWEKSSKDSLNKDIDNAVKKTAHKKKNESLSLNESSGTEYEIYFSDLTPEAQKDLLDFVGIASPKELNWDVYPIAMLFDFSDELEEI
jgi:hypothetical protein